MISDKEESLTREGLLEGLPNRSSQGLVLDKAALTEAQKALVERPTMSIRTKIILGFSLLFILCAVANITYLILGGQVEKKVRGMETVNNYSFEIQQARRYENLLIVLRGHVAGGGGQCFGPGQN